MPAPGKGDHHSSSWPRAAEPFAVSGRPSATRAARSFKPRRGRFTPQQRVAYEVLAPALLLTPVVGPLDHQAAFGRVAPLVVDIGFGMGDSTIALAHQFPDRNILGIDVHVPGIANVALHADTIGLRNIRLIATDAIDVLTYMLSEGSVRLMQIAFPDPWPKVSQAHRRLVDEAFIERTGRCLDDGGEFRAATDSPGYAAQMLRVLTMSHMMRNSAREPFAHRNPMRPVTKYERRAIDAGRPIFELCFERVQRDGSNTAGST